MKSRLTLKTMLTATAGCVLIALLEIFEYFTSPVHLFTPRDFLYILYGIIVLIGWAVYFLDRFKNR